MCTSNFLDFIQYGQKRFASTRQLPLSSLEVFVTSAMDFKSSEALVRTVPARSSDLAARVI